MEKTDGVRSLRGAVVFSEQGIWFLIAICILAAAFRLQSLAFLTAALVLVWLVSRLWSKLAPLSITVEEKGTARRVFPGEAVSSRLTITNAKWLPAPWLEISRSLTGGLLCLPGSPYRPKSDRLVCRMGWLAGWQEASWPVHWRAGRRGAYKAQPSFLRAGDPSSFFYREMPLPDEEGELLVYPRLFSLPEVAPGWQQSLGDQRSVDFRFADPLLVAGLRDYQPGDPLRRINWVASARTGSLKANIWEGSAQVRSLVCLETLSLTKSAWDASTGDLAFELLVSAAASMICQLAGRSGEVGFLSDVSHPLSVPGKPCYVPAASSRGQRYLVAMLDLLARLKPGPAAAPAQLVSKVRLPARCTLLMVTAQWTEALAASWERAWPGRRLVWLTLDGTSRDGDRREVYPLFPGWGGDDQLRASVLGPAEGGTIP
jgi:uncharacterized protein (DUF58 family)